MNTIRSGLSRRLRHQRSRWSRPGKSGGRVPERLEDRVLLAVGPQLISVQPNYGDVLGDGSVRDVAPQQLTFVFNEGQQIDELTLDGIRITRAGFDNAFDGVTDVVVQPGYLGVDPDRPNQVVCRFAETLPDDLYRVEVFAIDDPTAGYVAVRNAAGDPLVPKIAGTDRDTIGFALDLGAQVVAVVPQPVKRLPGGSLSQARNQIEVYFNEDDLDSASATNVNFYELIFTADTTTNTDDVIHRPTLASYDAAANLVTLTFANDLALLATGEGTYRLRIGTDEQILAQPEIKPVAQDPGSSFDMAHALGKLNRSQVLQAGIEPVDFPLRFPGGNDDLGHREIVPQTHLVAEADSTPGITVVQYNFQEIYGQDPQGRNLFNLITEAQKQRAREIFEVYAFYLGAQFIETEAEGWTIVTGDIRLLDPAAQVSPGGILGISGAHPVTGVPISIMDSSELWDDAFGETSDPARFSWFETAMHEIGHMVGIGHTDELPPYTLMDQDLELGFLSTPEYVFPGLHDIIHGQYLHRPESNDIDLYRFELDKPGDFKAEIIAERRLDSSLLDSVLTLYEERNGQRQIVSRNDDYFSEDSFLALNLEAGVYYLAVTSTGNTAFDPTVKDSGFGGTTQGPYDLRFDFRPRVDNYLVDARDGLRRRRRRCPGGRLQLLAPRGAGAGPGVCRQGGADRWRWNPRASVPRVGPALNDPVHKPQPGQILRVVGNGGADGNLDTLTRQPGVRTRDPRRPRAGGWARSGRASRRDRARRWRHDLQVAQEHRAGGQFFGHDRSQRIGSADPRHARRTRFFSRRTTMNRPVWTPTRA